MPSNGGEFSRWLDGSAHIARQRVKMCKNVEMISDKKRVTKPRMRTYTTYAVVRIYLYIEKSARCND